MTASLSEVVQLLSFDGSIFVGQFYQTEKVLLQEFSSLSITVTTSENGSLRLSFSNNGVDFDYNSTTTLAANAPNTITSVILGKWCRIRVLNAGLVANLVRFSTYCQIKPIALQAQIEKQGNKFPSVNIDNFTGSLFNDLRVCENKIIHQHKFDYGRIQSNVLVDPDRGLVPFSGGGINPALTVQNITSGILSMDDIFKSPVGSYLGVKGPTVVYVSGNPLMVSFSAKFDVSGYTDADTFGYDHMLVGAGWTSLGTPPDPPAGDVVDGIFVGYPSAPQAPDTIINEIALVYYNNGVENYVPQSRWLFDPLDGNGNSGLILDPSKLGIWRIRTAYHGACSIYLEYHNPVDNVWFPCHRIVYENLNTIANFQNPSFGALIYTKRTSTASGVGTNVVGPGSGSIDVGLENGISSKVDVYTYGLESGLITIGANVETLIMSIRAGELLNQKINRAVVLIMHLSLSTDGTKACTFKMYRNGSFVTPTWTYHNADYSPVQELTAGSPVIGSGELVVGHYAGKESASTLKVSELKVFMDYADTLTITCESTGASDVCVFLTYGLIR